MRKYIAIIKGPEHIIKGGMLIEKFECTRGFGLFHHDLIFSDL